MYPQSGYSLLTGLKKTWEPDLLIKYPLIELIIIRVILKKTVGGLHMRNRIITGGDIKVIKKSLKNT